MKISLIIPVLNEAPRIEILLSFLFQEVQDEELEVILVDGGSEDNTIELARTFPVRIIQTSRGRAKQMNAGATVAQGEVLYFVHADTRPPKSFPTDIRKAIRSHHLLGCYRSQFDSKLFLLRINAWFTRFNWLWTRGGDQTIYVEKKLFDQLGGFDEYFCVMEEYDFIQRALSQYPIHILPGSTLISARKYEQNNWLKVQWVNFRAFRMFRRNCDPRQIQSYYRKKLSL
ncbi:MAG: glycosyltransferase [Bacteroidetes bacterium]|nr:MAG: glycosyltransferase [Bacteroidota bacterium]